MSNLIIRTMGGDGVGYGHLYRCISLANAIINLCSEIRITFIINSQVVTLIDSSKFNVVVCDDIKGDLDIIQGLSPKLLVWDSYRGDNSHLIQIRKYCKLLLIDDNNDIYDSTIPDIVVNGNIHANQLCYNKSRHGNFFLGINYLVMKEEYWQRDIHNISDSNQGVMITTGGTDDFEISYQILKCITDIKVKKYIVIGPGYGLPLIKKIESCLDELTEIVYMPASLKRFINLARVVITAAGSTVYEVLSQKTMPIIFSLADNQDMVCHELEKRGIVYLGKYPALNYKLLSEHLSQSWDIEANGTDRGGLYDLIDGKGAMRVAKIILEAL